MRIQPVCVWTWAAPCKVNLWAIYYSLWSNVAMTLRLLGRTSGVWHGCFRGGFSCQVFFFWRCEERGQTERWKISHAAAPWHIYKHRGDSLNTELCKSSPSDSKLFSRKRSDPFGRKMWDDSRFKKKKGSDDRNKMSFRCFWKLPGLQVH